MNSKRRSKKRSPIGRTSDLIFGDTPKVKRWEHIQGIVHGEDFEETKDKYVKGIEHLVSLCKGECYDWRFFKLFIMCNNGVSNFLSKLDVVTPGVINNYLSGAWWVEKEDIRQEIYYWIWRLGVSSKTDLMTHIPGNLRDWLAFKQKVFWRQTNWEEPYLEYLKYINDKRWDEYSLPISELFINEWDEEFPDLSLLDKYFIYLRYGLKLKLSQIDNIFENTITYNEKQKLRQRIKNGNP